MRHIDNKKPLMLLLSLFILSIFLIYTPAEAQTSKTPNTPGKKTTGSGYKKTTGNTTKKTTGNSYKKTTGNKKTTSNKKTTGSSYKKTTASSLRNSSDYMTENRRQFLAVCYQMGTNLSKRGFTHDVSASSHSYSSALKNGRECNCAMYASWCLQEFGILSKGKCFYAKSSGRPSRGSWNKSKVQLVKYYKRCGSLKYKLKPGDVVCCTGKHHTCIYAGLNKKGQMTWYDAGRHSTRGGSTGDHYKPIRPSVNKYLEGRTIGYVIRIK